MIRLIIIGKLQAAGIVETKAGVGGSILSKQTDEITLLDVYKAVSEEDDSDRSVFNFHLNPNPKCPVGNKITTVLEDPLSAAQKALEEELNKTTIKDLMKRL